MHNRNTDCSISRMILHTLDRTIVMESMEGYNRGISTYIHSCRGGDGLCPWRRCSIRQGATRTLQCITRVTWKEQKEVQQGRTEKTVRGGLHPSQPNLLTPSLTSWMGRKQWQSMWVGGHSDVQCMGSCPSLQSKQSQRTTQHSSSHTLQDRECELHCNPSWWNNTLTRWMLHRHTISAHHLQSGTDSLVSRPIHSSLH